MSAWMFQGNPDTFDLDKYLGRTHEIVWTVKQKHFREDMREGDKVFLWSGMPPVSVPLLMLDLETVEGQQAGAF